MQRGLGVLLIGVAALLCACVERPQMTSEADKAQISQFVTTTAPKPRNALTLQFEDRAKLIGYDVDTTRVVPGTGFRVTWYWEATGSFDKGWRQFTHAIDHTGKSRLNLDTARVLDRLYHPHLWKKGQFIKDVQEITLPKDWKSNEVVLALGFWNGPHRLEVVEGPKDAEGRGVALKLPVSSDSGPALPQLTATHTITPPVLDGKLTESMWLSATGTGHFVNTMRGSRAAFVTEAWIGYGAEALYVGFEVVDDHLKSRFLNADDHLWEQDAVEIMVDPDGDGLNYFELQVSPRGKVFDTRYDSRRRPRPFGDMAWNSGLQAGVSVRGTIDDDSTDEGYTAEIAIPWSAFAVGSHPAQPPAASAQWRINLYVMDARDRGQRAAGWSPPLVGDFHIPERFGVVTFPQAARPASPDATPTTSTAVVPAPAATGGPSTTEAAVKEPSKPKAQ